MAGFSYQVTEKHYTNEQQRYRAEFAQFMAAYAATTDGMAGSYQNRASLSVGFAHECMRQLDAAMAEKFNKEQE